MFGFLMMPMQTFACKKISSHSCCETSSKEDKKDCCKKEKSENEKKSNCDGKCKGSCPVPSCFNLTLVSVQDFECQFVFLYSKKQTFYDKDATISSGFLSLWFIPKIS